MSFTLEYPYDVPTMQVVLPSPDYGDSHSVDVKVSTFDTMDGGIRSYRRTGDTDSWTYTFIIDLACQGTIMNDLNTVLLAAVGDYLKITYDGVAKLKCTTITPEYSLVKHQQYSVTLAFEGEPS